MKLIEGEYVKKIFHHHLTPFLYTLLKLFIGFAPFVFLYYFLMPVVSSLVFFILVLILILLFLITLAYVSLIYWLDRLYVTNFRVIYVDYKYLTIKDEASAYLKDIEDILTHEHGFLSYFRFFDYGVVKMDTPSSYVTIIFEDAPNPEGIRQFIMEARKNVL
ncbi:hypothetical protein KJ632_02715 [Patescibacteria group bacterium]|nr:hypothetical protein [Patescibacteria group bacterium]